MSRFLLANRDFFCGLLRERHPIVKCQSAIAITTTAWGFIRKPSIQIIPVFRHKPTNDSDFTSIET